MKILSKQFGEIPLHENFLLQGKYLKSYTYTCSNNSGEYSLYNLKSKLFSAWFIDVQSIKGNDKLTFVYPSPEIALHISILQSLVCPIPGNNKLLLHENSFILFYSPLSFAQIETTKDKHYHFFELFIDVSNLNRCKRRYKGMTNFLKSIDQNKLVRYYHHPLVIDFSKLLIIENLKVSDTEIKFNKTCKTILTDCLNIVTANNNISPKRVSLNEANKIYKVREYIDTHINEKLLSLQKIAQETKVSLYLIKHSFKKIYHSTPHQYLIVSRLKKALQLLAETNNTIDTIAFSIGIDFTRTFTRQFTHYYKITPLQYRKMLK